jgi:hypothetical protein
MLLSNHCSIAWTISIISIKSLLFRSFKFLSFGFLVNQKQPYSSSIKTEKNKITEII